MLIQIKNRHIADLPSLCKLVLKSIYCPGQMTTDESRFMEYSLEMWHNKVILLEDERYKLNMIDKFIEKNRSGKLERRKELFEKHGIDYRKVHANQRA